MIRLYYAVSIDGFIADSEGGVGWLDPFNDQDCGYESFVTDSDSVVFGRRTYQQQLGLGTWPFAGKRAFVLSSGAINDANVEAARDVDTILDGLQKSGAANTWIVGGAQAMSAFLARSAVDRIDHHVIPVVLGSGVPLFSGLRSLLSWQLPESRTFPNAVVHLRYENKR